MFIIALPFSKRKSLQFVRLGEHDLTSDDGMHQDVTIDLTLPHEDYDNDLLLNDIALIYLDYDVKYTGRFLRMIKSINLIFVF